MKFLQKKKLSETMKIAAVTILFKNGDNRHQHGDRLASSGDRLVCA